MRIQTIHTVDLIPIDLNSLFYKIEAIISQLSLESGDTTTAEMFQVNMLNRRFIINNLMWSNQLKSWADYEISKKTLKDTSFYLTNLSPLFMGIKPKNFLEIDIIYSHLDFLNKYDGGIPFSKINSSQQWDFANVWAPNQHGIIMMLLNHNKPMALTFAKKFFNSVYTGWNKEGAIFEKYSAIKVGQRGSGGEYTAQTVSLIQ